MQVAQGRLRQLLATMIGVLGLVAAYFSTGCGGHGLSLTGTWGGLLIFFGLRSVLSSAGVAWGVLAGAPVATGAPKAPDGPPALPSAS